MDRVFPCSTGSCPSVLQRLIALRLFQCRRVALPIGGFVDVMEDEPLPRAGRYLLMTRSRRDPRAPLPEP